MAWDAACHVVTGVQRNCDDFIVPYIYLRMWNGAETVQHAVKPPGNLPHICWRHCVGGNLEAAAVLEERKRKVWEVRAHEHGHV